MAYQTTLRVPDQARVNLLSALHRGLLQRQVGLDRFSTAYQQLEMEKTELLERIQLLKNPM